MRYYFHIKHDASYHDEIGNEFPDMEAAWNEAVKYAGEMIRELDGKMVAAPEWRMDVAAEGKQLFNFRFIVGRPGPPD